MSEVTENLERRGCEDPNSGVVSAVIVPGHIDVGEAAKLDSDVEMEGTRPVGD